jgi:3-methyladenine DNA glycosylase/8-oxoguanine DNA glycosylase
VPVLADRAVPPSPARLPSPGVDGTGARDGERVRRLLVVDGAPIVLTAAQEPGGALAFSAEAATQEHAAFGLRRARFWLQVDDDLTPFLERFAEDPLLGPSVTDAPWLRPYRRPLPWEVLLGAVCEQLVADERATDIKRAIVRAHGPQHDGLRAMPDAATVARLAPAELERCGLAAKRALTLVAVAREVAAGRVDLLADGERRHAGWRRLRALPGIGPWTLSVLALHGQGVHDALPAGDHAYQVAVARRLGLRGKASDQQVAELLEPYRPWRGVAGWHVLRLARQAGWLERDPTAGAWGRR